MAFERSLASLLIQRTYADDDAISERIPPEPSTAAAPEPVRDYGPQG
jgi:hypothetical protein